MKLPDNFDVPQIRPIEELIDMSVFADIDRSINESLQERQANIEVLVNGAQANIAQKELLEEQLKAVKEQNEQLKEQCDLLKELYETAKSQAEENRQLAIKNAKEAKNNKIFGWVTFAVGSLIGLAGILAGIFCS